MQEVEEDRKHGKTTVAVKMLFWRAIVNGVLAPPLVVLVVPLTSDKKSNGKPDQFARGDGVGMNLRGGLRAFDYVN